MRKFPEKLFELLEDASKEGNESIISWMGGCSFKVHSKTDIENILFPRYFPGSSVNRYRNFQRQLSIYDFQLESTTGAYYHPLFIQSKPELCASMQRNAIKDDSKRRRRTTIANHFQQLLDVPSSSLNILPPTIGLKRGDSIQSTYNHETRIQRGTNQRNLQDIHISKPASSSLGPQSNAIAPKINPTYSIPSENFNKPKEEKSTNVSQYLETFAEASFRFLCHPEQRQSQSSINTFLESWSPMDRLLDFEKLENSSNQQKASSTQENSSPVVYNITEVRIQDTASSEDFSTGIFDDPSDHVVLDKMMINGAEFAMSNFSQRCVSTTPIWSKDDDVISPNDCMEDSVAKDLNSTTTESFTMKSVKSARRHNPQNQLQWISNKFDDMSNGPM